MKISNIITLVKAGYTPAEISALERADDVLQLLNEGATKEDIPALLELSSDVTEPAPAPENILSQPPEEEPPEPAADPVDYKKMYNDLLKQTQAANVRGNIAEDIPNNEDVIKEIVKSFM